MWIGRRWHSARSWFGRRSWRAKLLLGAALFTSPCWCGCGGGWLWLEGHHWLVLTSEDRAYRRTERASYPDGLPSVARRLKAEMEPIPDPDIALRQHPDWAAFRFKNGEWIFGRGIDSHNPFGHGRGTLVVKDSRGQVRIFFGHVCGENMPVLFPPYGAHTLDAYYTQMQEGTILREWVPGP